MLFIESLKAKQQ